MNQNILFLIQDDIKITRLSKSLSRLNIDANDINLHNSFVIFSLMNIKGSDDNQNKYSELMDGLCDTEEEGKILAEKMLDELLKLN